MGNAAENRTRTMSPSVYARAAMLRRAQSKARTLRVNRTPNAPLAPTMENARDGLEVAFEATSDLQPDRARQVKRPVVRSSVRAQYQGRDVFGGIQRPGAHIRYGQHMRLHRGRWIVRNDAWSRERSTEAGQAKVAGLVAERYALSVRAENVSGIGTGGYVKVWTASGDRPQWKDHGKSEYDLGAETPSDHGPRVAVFGGLPYQYVRDGASGTWALVKGLEA